MFQIRSPGSYWLCNPGQVPFSKPHLIHLLNGSNKSPIYKLL